LKNFLISVVGPTASGKTDLGIRIAEHFNSEIVSADSRQFFKEMPIGTAQPNTEELKKIKHHFIANLSIHDEMNVGKFEVDAIQCLDKLFQKNAIQVLVGGSGLYVDAVLRGFDNVPPKDDTIRKELITDYEKLGIEFLRNKLKELDPIQFSKMDTSNPQRLMRALEICLITGKTNDHYKKQSYASRNFTSIKIGIDLDREILYDRINRRVDQMMELGLLKEVEKLFPFKHLGPLQTVGYKELFDFMEGKTDLEKAIDLIKQHTRNFAKRQMTWFRRDQDIRWIKFEKIEAYLLTLEKEIK
jgi:tRNA dimethylallyltransferase